MTPTRRPGPGGGVRATSTPTPGGAQGRASPTVTPTRSGGIFRVNVNTLKSGECTNLHWSGEDLVGVYLNNSPVTGKETRRVCLTQATT